MFSLTQKCISFFLSLSIVLGGNFSLVQISHAETLRADTVSFSDESFPWLQENHLTSIKSIDDFRPHASISRGEAAKFLTNFALSMQLEKSQDTCSFTDTATYDSTLRGYTVESCQYRLFRGANGKFSPYSNITEAQALAVIGRALYGIQDETGSLWYSEYYAIGQEIGLITNETPASVGSTNITREKLATWLYIASQSDTDTKSRSSSDGDTIIYETDVDGPSDCSSYEQYDSARKVCSYSCISESECTSIQSQIDAELNNWSDELDGTDRSAPESGGEATTENSLVLYTVSNGEKITKMSGSDTQEYQSLWKEVADLAPDTLSDTYIENFEVYSDAKSDVIAYVSDDDGNGKWKLSINLPTHKLSDTKEQKTTLIHELSHIITLNKEQFMTPSGKCPNYSTQEGCAKSSAYLNLFVKKFWGTKTTADYDAKTFVTEYATTNPEEDIAESFAFFVLTSNFSDTTIKDQKVNFFNTYPELVVIRNEMRSTLASDVIRAKKLKK